MNYLKPVQQTSKRVFEKEWDESNERQIVRNLTWVLGVNTLFYSILIFSQIPCIQNKITSQPTSKSNFWFLVYLDFCSWAIFALNLFSLVLHKKQILYFSSRRALGNQPRRQVASSEVRNSSHPICKTRSSIYRPTYDTDTCWIWMSIMGME